MILLFLILIIQLAQWTWLWKLSLTPIKRQTPQHKPVEKPPQGKLSITHVPCIVAETEEAFSVRLRDGQPPESCLPKSGTGTLVYSGTKDESGRYVYNQKSE